MCHLQYLIMYLVKVHFLRVSYSSVERKDWLWLFIIDRVLILFLLLFFVLSHVNGK
jgi:hypothetical protein